MRHLAICGLWLALCPVPCSLWAAEAASTRAGNQRPLDLKAPQIGQIFSFEQIDAALRRAAELERIEVEATRLDGVPFQDRSTSPLLAAARTAAWLVTPSTIFASRVNTLPAAMYSHRPEPFLQANYWPSFAER